jgi:molybdopterin converting factor small subunit
VGEPLSNARLNASIGPSDTALSKGMEVIFMTTAYP